MTPTEEILTQRVISPWTMSVEKIRYWLESQLRVDELMERLPKGLVGADRARVQHLVYGVIRANMDIKSRRDVRNYLEEICTGKSSLLKNVTSGYHYHTICAESEEVLDAIQEELKQKGFLAKLQDYEPVDFWGDNEDEAKA